MSSSSKETKNAKCSASMRIHHRSGKLPVLRGVQGFNAWVSWDRKTKAQRAVFDVHRSLISPHFVQLFFTDKSPLFWEEAHLLLPRCICLECRDVCCLVQILMLLSQGSLSSDKPLFAEGLQLFPTYHPKSVLCSVGLTKSHLLPTLLTSAQVHFLPPVLWDCPGFSPVDLVG